MSQNLKNMLAAFIAMGVAPEAEALVTALVGEVCSIQDAVSGHILETHDNLHRKINGVADDSTEVLKTHSDILGEQVKVNTNHVERIAALESVTENLMTVTAEAHDVATTASTLSNDAANKVASHEQRLAQVEKFAQPLLGVVEPEQTPPAQAT